MVEFNTVKFLFQLQNKFEISVHSKKLTRTILTGLAG